MILFYIIFYVLAILVIIADVVSTVSYIKSADRKAQYTLAEIKAIRQLRNTLEKYVNGNP